MPKNKYKIEYLPIADRDLAEIFTYIAIDLAAPQAAVNLLEKIDRSIKLLETFPYAHSVYQPISLQSQAIPFEFRSLIVNSYIIYYYITENIVTIARIVCSRRDIQDVFNDWLY